MSTAQNTAMESRNPMSLANRPDFLVSGDTRGTENIGTADVKFPALKIAQAGSPEVKRAESAYIEGLREGDLFNSVTKHVYGEEVKILIVNQLGHRHIEFAPQSEGGGVIDFNVKDGDPRTEFTSQTINGKEVRVRPKATKFYDYLILLLGERGNDLMTMSLKSTQLKKAINLNTLLKASKLPSFAMVVTAKAVPEKAGQYSIYGWKYDVSAWPSEAQYNEAGAAYEKLRDKQVAVEVETKQDDDIESAAVPNGVVGDDIPF